MTLVEPEEPVRPEIRVEDHPARKLLLLLSIIAIGLVSVAILRPTGESTEEWLAPYIGSSLRVMIHTDPGAAPDDLEWLEPVTLMEIAPRDGVPSALLLLEEMSPAGDPGAPAELWLPLERVAEVWVGPKRVFRDRN